MKIFKSTTQAEYIFSLNNINVLIVCGDMIVDMISNKKRSPIVTEISIRGRKVNISIFFYHTVLFQVPKNVRLTCTHSFILKILNK